MGREEALAEAKRRAKGAWADACKAGIIGGVQMYSVQWHVGYRLNEEGGDWRVRVIAEGTGDSYEAAFADATARASRGGS